MAAGSSTVDHARARQPRQDLLCQVFVGLDRSAVGVGVEPLLPAPKTGWSAGEAPAAHHPRFEGCRGQGHAGHADAPVTRRTTITGPERLHEQLRVGGVPAQPVPSIETKRDAVSPGERPAAHAPASASRPPRRSPNVRRRFAVEQAAAGGLDAAFGEVAVGREPVGAGEAAHHVGRVGVQNGGRVAQRESGHGMGVEQVAQVRSEPMGRQRWRVRAVVGGSGRRSGQGRWACRRKLK
jgi:hypothetical protein